MFAREQKHEYDPTLVQPLDRPLAAGRPLSTVIQGNAYGGSGLPLKGFPHARSESQTKIPVLSPAKTSPAKLPTQSSFASPAKSPPQEGRASPTKSSLVSNGRFNSPQYNGDSSAVFSDDEDNVQQTPRPLRRHAKSVTFDTKPPQITEFEMVTPDPSVTTASRDGSYDSEEETEEEMSFDQDDSFDASLEDTDKTPVVLPEDWRHMSPDAADTSLTDTYDDVFEGRENSPMPSANPNGPRYESRLGSTASDGDARPLPPLPGFSAQDGSRRRDSSVGLSAAAERVNDRRRSLPQLPQAAGISKSDLLNMREVSMTLEDRMRLLNVENDRDTSTPTQEMQDKKNKQAEEDVTEADVDQSEITAEELRLVPRISRESILRRVKSRNFQDGEGDDSDAEYSNFEPEYSPERSYGDLADLDPDVPIPSREPSSNFDEHPRQASHSEADSVVDAYNYGDVAHGDPADATDVDGSSMSDLEDYERESSVIHHPMPQESEDEDDESQYSPVPEEQPTSQSTIDSSGPPTPTAAPSSPVAEKKQDEQDHSYCNFEDKDTDLSLDPVKAPLDTVPGPLDNAPKLEAMRESLQRPVTPEPADAEDDDSESDAPSTPGSVIRHPIPQSPLPNEDIEVPQREATIRGAGGKLKTRPSLIPDEVDMAATRRQVSGGFAPPVPERSPKRQSLGLDMSNVDEEDSQLSLTTRENRMLDLKLGDLNLGDDSNDLSFGLDKEFDHIIASQKKGYMMRENTKVVVASSRQFSDEKPPTGDGAPESVARITSRKASIERKPWTKEPWNGKPRRKSIRTASGRRARTSEGPAPPLPGQDSAVSGGLGAVAEQSADDQFEDGEERGRVFVKVIGVKDLDLPLPKKERVNFQLTLDNGLHCVTTAWLELSQSAPIGQEFELVVLDDLEFQLTLQTKLEPPVAPQVVVPPTKIVNHKKSHSAFRNLLSSPKKRKEQERKAQEEADRIALQEQQEAQAAAKRNYQATAWDLLHDLVGPDGSFARAYVCLSNHENQAYGRPLTVDVPCFNEWAVDNTGGSSVKSKRGGVVRRPPYRVGKLTLQLLYVPRPKNAKDEDMPKSMNACIRELKEAEQVKDISFEGTLSQQGGDCPVSTSHNHWFTIAN